MSYRSGPQRDVWKRLNSGDLRARIRQRVWNAIYENGRSTCEQVEKITGMKHQSVSAAINHLWLDGMLKRKDVVDSNGCRVSEYEVPRKPLQPPNPCRWCDSPMYDSTLGVVNTKVHGKTLLACPACAHLLARALMGDTE